MAYRLTSDGHRHAGVTHSQRPAKGHEEEDLEATFDGDINSFLTAAIRRHVALRLWGSGDMGPCSYCGDSYSQAAASKHFIPCCYCDSLEHAGCCH